MSARKAAVRPSPWMDAWALVNRLARAGWGEGFAVPYFRAARMVLREMSTLMYTSKRGRRGSLDITGPQLADLTGYCEKTARKGLEMLEDLGLIDWWRGGIVEGAPRPSLVTIHKGVLADFVYAARRWHDEVLDARTLAVKARIKATVTYRRCKGRPARQKLHPEASSILPLSGRLGARAPLALPKNSSSAKTNQDPHPTTGGKTMGDVPDPEFMPLVCGHGADAPRWCNACRSEGWQRQQAAARALERVKQGRKRAAEAARERAKMLPTPFEEYMRATYPDATPRQWGPLALKDPEAKRLARESHRG